MKALFVDPPGRLALREVEKPAAREGEIQVKMKCCGICGTDLEKVFGEALTSKVLGHEAVGEVSDVGEGVKGVAVGDRVFTHHHVPCYACNLCRRGEYTLCAEFSKHALQPCGFAEYYVLPKWNVARGGVIKLPDGLGYEEASFVEPLACCIRGLEKTGVRNFSSALIYGAGPVGLLHLKLMKSQGLHRVLLADISEYRLEFAKKFGASATFNPNDPTERTAALASLDEGRPELVVVATGNVRAFEDALTTVAKGGTIMLFGAPPKHSTVQIDLGELFMRGTRFVACYSASEKETVLATRLLSEDTVSVSDLITHRYDLSGSPEAFSAAREQRCVKAVVLN